MGAGKAGTIFTPTHHCTAFSDCHRKHWLVLRASPVLPSWGRFQVVASTSDRIKGQGLRASASLHGQWRPRAEPTIALISVCQDYELFERKSSESAYDNTMTLFSVVSHMLGLLLTPIKGCGFSPKSFLEKSNNQIK